MSRVLVIDGYEPIRQTMEFCLPRFGHAALTACDGTEARRLAAEQAIDVVLLDGAQRWANGCAVCAQLKRDEHLAGTPVVMMAAMVSAEMRGQARAAGAAEVVTKPFNWPELLELLARLAPGAEATAPAAERRAGGG
ncbi:MAG TPA: response regulator [Opitutus sp.]|nr:response regulator [Opitutus sp.]